MMFDGESFVSFSPSLSLASIVLSSAFLTPY